ncbi:MAG: preprotein translocase subunit YajC [Planctomycetes bacterium]|nr:preprotein translocase subunit YajC [Planctomycetota bacterium]
MLNLILTLIQDKPQQPAPPFGQQLIAMLLPIMLCFLIFWFLLIRPQKKEAQKKQEMLNSLEKDDHVWIAPGIYGIIERIKGDQVIVKIDESNDVKIRVMKSAIIGVEGKASIEKKEDNKKENQISK